jgi:hypothetical protein
MAIEKQKRLSTTGYSIIAIAGFIFSALAVFLYLRYMATNPNQQTGQQIFYLILVLFGVAISAVVFGLMNAYASLKHQKPDTKLTLTGPAVGVLLVVLGGFYLPKPDDSKRIITIRVFNKNKTPLTKGEVKLYLSDYIRIQSIDNNGQAQFAGVPPDYMQQAMKVEVSSPGYMPTQMDTMLKENVPLELVLPFYEVVILEGFIRKADETPIKDVEVSVDGTRYYDVSDNDGSFSIRLLEYTVDDEVTLTTSHPEYEDKSTRLHLGGPKLSGIKIYLNPARIN